MNRIIQKSLPLLWIFPFALFLPLIQGCARLDHTPPLPAATATRPDTGEVTAARGRFRRISFHSATSLASDDPLLTFTQEDVLNPRNTVSRGITVRAGQIKLVEDDYGGVLGGPDDRRYAFFRAVPDTDPQDDAGYLGAGFMLDSARPGDSAWFIYSPRNSGMYGNQEGYWALLWRNGVDGTGDFTIQAWDDSSTGGPYSAFRFGQEGGRFNILPGGGFNMKNGSTQVWNLSPNFMGSEDTVAVWKVDGVLFRTADLGVWFQNEAGEEVLDVLYDHADDALEATQVEIESRADADSEAMRRRDIVGHIMVEESTVVPDVPYVLVEDFTETITLTLASNLVYPGNRVTVKVATAPGEESVEIVTEGKAAIEGEASLTLDSPWESVTLFCDGFDWHVVNHSNTS